MQIGYYRQDEKLFQTLTLCHGVNLSDQNASFSQFLYSGQFYIKGYLIKQFSCLVQVYGSINCC